MIDKAEQEQLKRLDASISYATETDEFWSFVGNKHNQRWTWLAIEKTSGAVVAWHNGKRTDDDLQALLNLMCDIPINKYYTDDWGGYKRMLPTEKHIVGKAETWKIERKNLNFRTHIKRLSRRTICYSRSELIHDNVIGMYIERYYYRQGSFSNQCINLFKP